jgi:hypothetical protein
MEQYSSLEVDPQRTAANYADWPHAVPELDHPQKEAVPQDNYPEVVPSQQQPKQEGFGDGSGGYEALNSNAGGYRERRICGLRRRTFYILLGVAIVVVCGAIAGGVAGGVTSSKSKKSSSPGASPSSSNITSSQPARNILDTSTLSAINWTDTNSYEHRIVVFQDPYNAIVARRWDSQNETWTTSNITAVMEASTTPLIPMSGTALAVTGLDDRPSNAYGLHLFFINEDNLIASVWLSNPLKLPDKWQNETLDGALIETYPGSRLAATWQRCPAVSGSDCIGNWIVAYQAPGTGAISVTNHSDWSSTSQAVDGTDVVFNSSMAIIPQYLGVNDQLGLATESYDSADSGSMQLSSYSDSGSWSGVGEYAPTRTKQA